MDVESVITLKIHMHLTRAHVGTGHSLLSQGQSARQLPLWGMSQMQIAHRTPLVQSMKGFTKKTIEPYLSQGAVMAQVHEQHVA